MWRWWPEVNSSPPQVGIITTPIGKLWLRQAQFSPSRGHILFWILTREQEKKILHFRNFSFNSWPISLSLTILPRYTTTPVLPKISLPSGQGIYFFCSLASSISWSCLQIRWLLMWVAKERNWLFLFTETD